MKATLYLIGECSGYGDYGKEEKVKVERYDFDTDNPDDQSTLEEYAEEGELPLTQETFETVCRRFIDESENDWGQRGVASLVLTQEQMDKMFAVVPTLKNCLV